MGEQKSTTFRYDKKQEGRLADRSSCWYRFALVNIIAGLFRVAVVRVLTNPQSSRAASKDGCPILDAGKSEKIVGYSWACFLNLLSTTIAPIIAGKNNRKERCNKVKIGTRATGTILEKRTEILTSAKPLPPGLGAK